MELWSLQCVQDAVWVPTGQGEVFTYPSIPANPQAAGELLRESLSWAGRQVVCGESTRQGTKLCREEGKGS